MTLWETSKKRYVEKYFYKDAKDISTKEMDLGSDFGLFMELGGEHLGVGKCDIAEHIFCVDCYGVLLYLKLDTCMKDYSVFREYKTGRVPWTQGKANKHGQLLFYATGIYLKTKKIPKVYLDWLETEVVDGKVEFTGKTASFEVVFGLKDILEMMSRIRKNAIAIDKCYREHLENTI